MKINEFEFFQLIIDSEKKLPKKQRKTQNNNV